MPHYRKAVDTAFFQCWSDPMAYVLGYFAADGSMYVNSHGSRYVGFVSTDYELLHNVKGLLRAEHEITLRRRQHGPAHWKPVHQLQFGGRELYESLTRLGFTPNKDEVMRFPKVPLDYLSSFTRGYFDGDGCLGLGWYQQANRKSRSLYVQLCFAAGNLEFLKGLDDALQPAVGIHTGYIRRRDIGCYLYYQRRPDIRRFYEFFYPPGLPSSLFLVRKREKFQDAMRLLGA